MVVLIRFSRLALAAASVVLSGLSVAPMTAAAQGRPAATSQVTVGALAGMLEVTGLQTTRQLTANRTPAAQHTPQLVAALEAAIAGSGATPEVAIEALEATAKTMSAKGTLTPALKAAIDELLARIRAFVALDDAPGSFGRDTGNAAFSAPPPAPGSGGGGTSDYR